jgi:hypothetical protein
LDTAVRFFRASGIRTGARVLSKESCKALIFSPRNRSSSKPACERQDIPDILICKSGWITLTNQNKSLIEQVNRRKWWHSPPRDSASYRKRGVFLASSYRECEFYGRPLDEPVEVKISKPLVGTEENIIKSLYGKESRQMDAYRALAGNLDVDILKVRFQLDADLFEVAKGKGYDAIVVVAEKNTFQVKQGKLPRKAELNVFDAEKTTIGPRAGRRV